MQITLDKLEESILENLKEKTGKSEKDIIKLALHEMNAIAHRGMRSLLPFPFVPYYQVPTEGKDF